DEIGKILHSRLITIQKQIEGLSEAQWLENFVSNCQQKSDELKTLWETTWVNETDGKRVLSELHKHARSNISLRELKRIVVLAMAKRPTDNWRVVDSTLASLFAPA